MSGSRSTNIIMLVTLLARTAPQHQSGGGAGAPLCQTALHFVAPDTVDYNGRIAHRKCAADALTLKPQASNWYT
jgi:hypothetical protein